MTRRLFGGVGLAVLGLLATHCGGKAIIDSDPNGGGPASATGGSGPASGNADRASAGATDSGQGTAGRMPGGTAGSNQAVGSGGSSPSSVGKGGVGGSGGSAGLGPSVCDGIGSRVLANTPTDAFIEDFERKNMLDPTQPGAEWFAFNDLAVPNSVQLLRTAGGAATTAFSGRYAGTGAKTRSLGGYGVGLEFNVGMNLPIHQYCVDVSAFDGVSFWAKVGSPTNAVVAVGFAVPAQNSVMFGGDCPDDTPLQCENYPQKNLTLTTDWAQYTVNFNAVKGSTGATVVGSKIQQLLWLAPGSSWDFSLDELSFYRGVPPVGPVGVP